MALQPMDNSPPRPVSAAALSPTPDPRGRSKLAGTVGVSAAALLIWVLATYFL